MQPLDAQVHLLDEPHRLVALAYEPPPRRPTALQRHGTRHGDAEESALFQFDAPQRDEVRPQAPEEPLLLGGVRHRDLDGAVEPQRSRLNLLQHLHRAGEDEVVGQHRAPKQPPPMLDLPGVRHLQLTVEQRNAAHLQQIKPDRVVDDGRRAARTGRLAWLAR